MWAKMSRSGFLLLALSLSPLLVLLLMTPVTKLDLSTVLLFDLLSLPFITIGGVLERKDDQPFIVTSTFIPFVSLLITLTPGIFQIVGIIITASLLVNVFTYELGHKTGYREGYYIVILLTLALSVHPEVSLVLLTGAVLMHIAATKFGIQSEAMLFNGLFAVTTCEFIKLHLSIPWRFCGIAWIIALLYSTLSLVIIKKHRPHNNGTWLKGC